MTPLSETSKSNLRLRVLNFQAEPRPFSFDITNGGIDIFWNDIAAVQQATCHVFTSTWVTFDHLIMSFKARIGDLLDRVRFMTCSIFGNNWSVGGEWKMNAWVWNQVSLKLIQVNIQGSIESERCCDR